jgi:DNA-binding response OmpR family regulator
VSTPLQILLAEDNPADVALVRRALAQHEIDCELSVAQDGEQAELLISGVEARGRGARFDLCLIDLNLPKKPGQDVLRKLRSTNGWASTPIIVITSSDSIQDRDEARKLGANRYFRKPSRLGEFMELGALIRELLNQHGVAV